MEKINIKRRELLKTLEHNLITHEKLYQASTKAFKKNYISLLSRMAKDGMKDKFQFHVPLSKPQNFAQNYKDAIKMVQMDCRDIIILSEQEFMRYILNKWEWMSSFKSTFYSNIHYASSGRSGSSGTSGKSGMSGSSGMSSVAKQYFGDDDDN